MGPIHHLLVGTNSEQGQKRGKGPPEGFAKLVMETIVPESRARQMHTSLSFENRLLDYDGKIFLLWQCCGILRLKGTTFEGSLKFFRRPSYFRGDFQPVESDGGAGW